MNKNSDISEQLKYAIKILDKSYSYKVKFQRIPSIAFGIVYGNKIIFNKGYGFADIDNQIKATSSTDYRIASITKIFTAVALMQLVERNKIDLDSKVQNYLSWFKSKEDKYLENITVHQLLTHTSGLDRDGNTPHWETGIFPTLEEIKKHVQGNPSVFAPLEKWKYSNFGYGILGQIIEVVSKESYNNYVSKNIIDKLGLKYTSPKLSEKIKSNLARGYLRDIPGKKREAFPSYETNALTPAAGMSSNVEDLCRFIQSLFFKNNILISDKSKRELLKIQKIKEGLVESERSLGFFSWKVNKKRIYVHGGGFQGYKTVIGIDFKRNIGIVVLTNATDAYPIPMLKGAFETIDYLIKNYSEFKPKKPIKNINRYEGTFSSFWGEINNIEVHGGLISVTSGLSKPLENFLILKQEEENTFRITGKDGQENTGELTRYIFDKNGTVKEVYIGPNPLKPLT